ncbi:tRNA lysidine(34) synthetase TilS [Halothermothrix orenii]|uniref:tRNA(Ile)-lysidine synthase n=1 Tax=Halothermothrix orenii (strain H 168 / OCM 544 / DSM 9562) TaxID=373903 RepID=B8D063_HALOH|nr:tRNA lysidine(34) synthetase TilS [Halothermothrix orenii]ACL68817.1 tRNA(Ile)-lysidine synthetase [Halothermothrix orenii H 168]
MELLKKFREYINHHKLIKKGDGVLVGVSGGPDSLTLLDMLVRVKDEYGLKLVVFHLDHKFRQEAAREARYVSNITNNYGLKCIIEEFDVPGLMNDEGLSPEEAARKVRFNLMIKWVNSLNLNKIAVAHNKDDLVETVFLHMFRGTGLKGLTGIDPVSRIGGVEVIHPLLNIYRQEIMDYCQRRNLNPVYDPTNQETIYTRNKIRHHIIPYIEDEINPGLKDVIYQMAEVVREENNFLDYQAEKNLKKVLVDKGQDYVILSLEKLFKLPLVIRRRITSLVNSKLKGEDNNLYRKHYEMVENLIKSKVTGKRFDLPDGVVVEKSYDKIIFRKNKKINEYCINFNIPAEIDLPRGIILKVSEEKLPSNWRQLVQNPGICLCDLEKIELPLIVRPRKPGDRFIPLGMKGYKKVKNFFIDEKIPRYQRENIPVILDNKGRIIWLAGLRMDDRFKITDDTKKIVRFEITNNKEE